MNKAIFRYSIAIVSCCMGVFLILQLFSKKEKKVAPITEQRDTSGIDPFAVAHSVELVTYKSDRMDWWINEDGLDKPLLKNGMLTIPTDSIHSRLNLDASAIAKWQSALYVQQFCEEKIIGLCYKPRHLLLFYNSDNRIFGYIEICLSCAGGRISEGLREVIFCPERVEYLTKLVEEILKIKVSL